MHNHPGKRAWLWAAILTCILMMAAAGALAERTVAYRIRPAVERQDVLRKDGTVYIGRTRGKARTAQLLLNPEGRSPSGETVNLSRLLKEKKGTVISAWWRLETRDCAEKEGRFLLWPKGDRKSIQSQRLLEGWNLWNVTDLIREMIVRGQEMSVRLQAADGSGNAGAAFDLENSWIYVNISFPEEATDEENLITDSDLLDTALSALPEGHWALEQYRKITDAIVVPVWPQTGAPYYFGGHKEEKVLHPYTPSQASRYYRPGKYYLGGFDCSSFIRWVQENTGYAALDLLDQIIADRSNAFPVSRRNVENWMQALRPGDILVIDHGSYHVGMILGTPRMYGLTEENAPELAGWLDAPMMLHCGEDPFCYDRFEAYIAGLSYRLPITPPDGGVTVSLLVNSPGDAPHVRTAPWKTDYGYFRVLDQQMTVYPLSVCRKLAWLFPARETGTQTGKK